MRAFRVLPLMAVVLMVLPEAGSAQGLQLTPFIGYRLFGSLTDYTGTSVDVKDAMSYGGYATYIMQPGTGIEFGFSRQDTEARLSTPFQGVSTYDVKVNQWTLGGHREFAQRNQSVLPFLNGFLGLTHASSSDGDGSQTKFMLGGGGGVKLMNATRRVGLRLDARGYFTFAGGGGAAIGCGTGGCSVGFGSQALFQTDLTAGVVIGLGGGRR